ncbi:MAG TPA: tripartite tricarboxylate transporter substrate-binding protein [Beijerinckiaceae bacterium]|nr:tripartite tricarboxylate transporter substrate-binding protein [Beijerinckiaceae bacterium]
MPHWIARAAALALLSEACLTSSWPPASAADDSGDFFRGKTIRIIVGYPAGGGYDVYARLIARFLPTVLPGRPSVVVQNMPGAGSLIAANYLYSAADKDGTVIGALSGVAPFAPLQGLQGAMFDPRKFNWIGSPNSETGLLIVWHTAPFATIDDVRQHELLTASSSVEATTSFYARVLNATLGLKLKIVLGYPGSTDAFLAMERGEVQAYPSAFWSSLRSTKPDWLKQNQIKMLVQYGPKKNAELADVPFAENLVKDADDKTLLQAAVAPLAFGRPFALPPDVPADRVETWRKAIEDMCKNPDFLAEAAKQQLDVTPESGGDLQSILNRTYGLPPGIIAKLKSLAAQQSGN